MKKFVKILLATSLLMLALAITSFVCKAKSISIPSNGAILSGKTGDCMRYGFLIQAGQKVTVSLTSSDGKSRFSIENGDADDTGTTGWSNLITFSKALDSEGWQVEVQGTDNANFTLKITVTDA